MLLTEEIALLGTDGITLETAEGRPEARFVGAVNPGTKLDSAGKFDVAVTPPLLKMLLT